MVERVELQLGKKGITPTFLEELKKRFDKPTIKNVKISVLRSARAEGREDVKKYASEVKNYLGKKFTVHILGFSIFVKKWRKERE